MGRKVLFRLKLYLAVGAFFLLSSCTFLGNRSYVQQYPQYHGIKRVAVLVQRWPAYLQLPNQNNLGADFIKKTTLFTGPWQPAGLMDPRAVDIQDIDDGAVATLLMEALIEKGYQPFLSGVFPPQPGPITVEQIMAMGQAIDPEVDAFLFCFYSPTVFGADAAVTPKDHRTRSYGLGEIIGIINPGGSRVIWAGPRAAQAYTNSISHAFIFVSLTMFKASEWQTLWEMADSQVGNRMRLKLAQCPPAPTDQNYPADAAMIQRLMSNNLTCRLRHLIPDAF
jgi:hypothetical protein